MAIYKALTFRWSLNFDGASQHFFLIAAQYDSPGRLRSPVTSAAASAAIDNAFLEGRSKRSLAPHTFVNEDEISICTSYLKDK